MKPGLRMVAGLARVRRLDAKVRRLVRAAFYDPEPSDPVRDRMLRWVQPVPDEPPGMVLTSLDAWSEENARRSMEAMRHFVDFPRTPYVPFGGLVS